MKTPIALLAALAVTLSSFATEPARPNAARPNIIVFLVDDMGVMDTSLPFLTDKAGKPKRYPLNDFYRTPNMVRLAEKGIRFNQFYAMSVCSPTRISIMTGQNAARHHSTNWINPWQDNAGKQGPKEWQWKGLKSGDTTLPGLLSAEGYTSIHVGKGHFGPDDSDGADPANLGFDINIAGRSIGAPGSYYAEKNYGAGTKRARSAVPHLDKYHGSETFLSEALTIEAKKAVKGSVDEGKPFYLYFAHYAVHAPFESDPRFADHYKDSDKPANARAFATLVEGMDKSLGDMLDQLDELGVAENTLVLFLGDNGSDAPLGHQHEVACAAPLRGKKGAHYEGGIRVPFIAAWAKLNPDNSFQKQLPIAVGAIQPQVANVCDIFPTLLSITEVASPGGHKVDGAGLATLLSGQSDPDRAEKFLMHYPHGPHRSSYFTSYRNGDWKTIYHFVPGEDSAGARYQLFNLVNDPFEQSDLAESEPDELRRIVTELKAELKAHDGQNPLNESGETLEVIVP